MKAYIIHGNTRSTSNTEALAKLFTDALAANGAEVVHVSLRTKEIKSCVGCDKCHSITDTFGCAINDDMHEVAGEILSSDLIIFTSPIYTWMPTPPLKAVMDRMYAFTKYPENADAFNLLKNQKIAMISTSGDECVKNCDLFDESIRRMASFANLSYIGYLAAQDRGDGNIARPEVIDDAKAFADKCMTAFES